MKTKIYTLAIAASFSLAACEDDFLSETNRNAITTDVLCSTPEGYESLVNACYAYLKVWYGNADGCAFTEMGTDCYTGGGSSAGNVAAMAYYTNALNGSYPLMEYMWNNLYSAVNCCNAAIDRVDRPGLSEAKKKQFLGEVYFLRALYMHNITEVWGEVPLLTNEVQTPLTTAQKSTQEEIYRQIFADLDLAYQLLEGTAKKDNGRITQYAVKALQARLNLYRGNNAEAAKLAESFIGDSDLSFYDHFWETFCMANSNGQNNKEAIWWVNYCDNKDLMPAFEHYGMNSPSMGARYGSQQFLFSCMSYWCVSGSGVWVAPETHAPWVQCMPTLAFLQTFDEKNDSRYEDTFLDTWIVNSTKDNYSEDYGNTYAGHPLQLGDTAFILSKYDFTAKERAAHPYQIYGVYDMYDTLTHQPIGTRDYFIGTDKFADSTRATGWEYESSRDFVVFRLAEMYLIAAEAEMKLGNTDKALTYINTLRRQRAIKGHESEMEISAKELNIDFILDERGRELAMEQHRFFDLKRTGKFVERIKAANPDVPAHFDAHFAVRPIPQQELDAITNKAEFLQNEGYE